MAEQRSLAFSILGPVEARRRGSPLALGGRQPRAVLALLLLRRNEAVPVHALLDALWEDALPPTAAKALQGYVSRLRKALEPGRAASGFRRLVSHPDGYELRVAEGELDADRFRELHETGRRALASGRPAAASRDLRRALALWRGPALGDLAPAHFARAEAAALEDARLAALEDRFEAELALGLHAELVGELRAATEAEPWRERLWGQLMLALYRCGRQADALDAYRASRARLGDELGLDPGPELRRLEVAILNHDPALLDGGRPRLRTRASLATGATTLVGRRRELADVCARLRDPARRMVVLTGPGGAGKTRLALEAARALEPEFPDGVVFVELAGVRDPGLVVPALAQELGLREQPGVAIGATVGRALADRELLAVLDNLEQVPEATPAIAALLEGLPRTKAILTSRTALPLLGRHEYAIGPLGLPAPGETDPRAVARAPAVALFAQHVRRGDASFAVTAGNARAVADLCARLDGLPLALELAAARARVLSPAQILDRLDVRGVDRRGAAAHSRHETLGLAIEWSFDLLAEEERRLLLRSAVFRGGATLEALERVAGEPRLLDRLSSLVDKRLLVHRDGFAADWRFHMLETIREYALARLEESGDGAEARRAHAAWCLELAEAAAGELTGTRQLEHLGRLESEHDNLRAAFAWAEEAGDAEVELRLAVALQRLWIVHGHLSEGQARLDAALDRAAGAPPKLLAAGLAASSLLALIRDDLPHAAARARQSLSAHRRLGDDAGVAGALGTLGTALGFAGDREEGDPRLDEAIGLFRRLGARWSLAHSLNNRGCVALRGGDYASASRFCAESRAVFEELDDRHGLALVVGSSGAAALGLDDFDAAGAFYGESLRLHRELEDERGASFSLDGLAAVAAAGGRDEDAARLFGAAAGLRAELGWIAEPSEWPAVERAAAAVRARLGEPRWADALAEGRRLGLDAAAAAEPRAVPV